MIFADNRCRKFFDKNLEMEAIYLRIINQNKLRVSWANLGKGSVTNEWGKFPNRHITFDSLLLYIDNVNIIAV